MAYDQYNQVEQPGAVDTVCPWCHATIQEPTLKRHVIEFHRLVPSDAERLNKVLVDVDPAPRDWLDHEHQNEAGTICPWCWGDIAGQTLLQHIVDFHHLVPSDAERVQRALQIEPPSE